VLQEAPSKLHYRTDPESLELSGARAMRASHAEEGIAHAKSRDARVRQFSLAIVLSFRFWWWFPSWTWASWSVDQSHLHPTLLVVVAGINIPRALLLEIKVRRALYQRTTNHSNFRIELVYCTVKTRHYRRYTHDISPEALFFISAYSVSMLLDHNWRNWSCPSSGADHTNREAQVYTNISFVAIPYSIQ